MALPAATIKTRQIMFLIFGSLEAYSSGHATIGAL